jgi:hypothetical protein
MLVVNQPEIITSTRGCSHRWDCSEGDYVYWISRNPFQPSDDVKFRDLWSMPNDSAVIISNVPGSFPEWFVLQPTEVCDSLVPWMMDQLAKRTAPAEPIDGPSLWRAREGDRVVIARKGVAESFAITIIDCRASVAVFGVRSDGSPNLTQFWVFPHAVELAEATKHSEASMHRPRTFSPTWQLG